MIAELRNISKYYEQPVSGIRNRVLDGISLTVSETETIAITGPSGSGKSTLLNILGTLDPPSSGTVILNGTPVDRSIEKSLAALRNRFIGFVFQLHYLLPQLTLSENVLLPALPVKDRALRKRAVERAEYLIGRVGLQEHIHHLPYRMSVGECQRAAVIRALINQPQLLLADEPTGSLDQENAARMGELLREMNQEENVAIVLVTHAETLAAGMQKRFRLSSGKLHPA